MSASNELKLLVWGTTSRSGSSWIYSRGLTSRNKSPDLTPGLCCHSVEDKQRYSSHEISTQRPAAHPGFVVSP